MVQHSSDVSRAPRKLICRPTLGILAVLSYGAWATLQAQASDTVPARLISGRDTAPIIVPDTVRRGQEFTVKVTTFAGGCIDELAESGVRISGLVADVTLRHVRRVAGNACTSDELLFRQTVLVRFDTAGIGRIRFHGAANRLDFGAPPQLFGMECRVVVL